MKVAIKCPKKLTLLNLELKSPDISETTIITSTPPLYSSKGGTAHGEQERILSYVIYWAKGKEPNSHVSGKWRRTETSSTCLPAVCAAGSMT